MRRKIARAEPLLNCFFSILWVYDICELH